MWEMANLQSAYQVHLAHLGSPEAAWGQLFGGLGYAGRFAAGWEEAVSIFMADEARYLADADLYVLTPQMCDTVIAAALTLTVDDLTLIDAGDLPSPGGLVVLPHPVIVRAVNGDLGDDRASSWRSPMQLQAVTDDGRRQDLPAVRMSTYHDTSGPVRPDVFLRFAAQARAQGTPLPPLLHSATRCWPLRMPVTEDQVRSLQESSTRAHDIGEAARESSRNLGLAEDRVTGEYVPGTEVDDNDDLFTARFLCAFWRLCEQRIAVTSPAETGHSARVLAERAGVSPDVRIIRLRRAESAGDHDGGGREWHHRWVVRMHKVRQWYPSLQQHKIIYRGPYIKGPEGKPLLSGEKVQGLVR
jgi:hypothetical protein